jgi:hypothetical protein
VGLALFWLLPRQTEVKKTQKPVEG